MPDTFVIFYVGQSTPLVALCNLNTLCDTETIIQWYARTYDFDRKKLYGRWTHSIDVGGMKYEDFCR